MKLISISAGAKTKASYNGKVDEVSYEIVASKDRQQVATILNGHLIAYLPQANDSHSENLMPDEAYYAQQHGKYSASKEHQLESLVDLSRTTRTRRVTEVESNCPKSNIMQHHCVFVAPLCFCIM
jgi:hypothetical protein